MEWTGASLSHSPVQPSLVWMMGLFLAWLAAGCVCGDAPRFQVVTTVLPPGFGKAKAQVATAKKAMSLLKIPALHFYRLRLNILNSNTVVEDNPSILSAKSINLPIIYHLPTITNKCPSIRFHPGRHTFHTTQEVSVYPVSTITCKKKQPNFELFFQSIGCPYLMWFSSR